MAYAGQKALSGSVRVLIAWFDLHVSVSLLKDKLESDLEYLASRAFARYHGVAGERVSPRRMRTVCPLRY